MPADNPMTAGIVGASQTYWCTQIREMDSRSGPEDGVRIYQTKDAADEAYNKWNDRDRSLGVPDYYVITYEPFSITTHREYENGAYLSASKFRDIHEKTYLK